MTILCNLVHLRYEAVPSTLNTSQLVTLATLIDKYDCSGSTRLVFEYWLPQVNPSGSEEIYRLVSAAYLTNADISFRRLTIPLVFEHTLVAGREPYTSLIPIEVLCRYL